MKDVYYDPIGGPQAYLGRFDVIELGGSVILTDDGGFVTRYNGDDAFEASFNAEYR